jgi:hypothetical protein
MKKLHTWTERAIFVAESQGYSVVAIVDENGKLLAGEMLDLPEWQAWRDIELDGYVGFEAPVVNGELDLTYVAWGCAGLEGVLFRKTGKTQQNSESQQAGIQENSPNCQRTGSLSGFGCRYVSVLGLA